MQATPGVATRTGFRRYAAHGITAHRLNAFVGRSVNMQHRSIVIACVLVLSACGATPESAREPSPAPRAAEVAKPPGPPPGAAASASSARDARTASALPPVEVPPGALYACVVGQGATRKQRTIDFEPRVADLCRRHPEMGPCQYEREACRRAGGRVFAANGMEITATTEAEYDRKVQRLRFRAN